GAAQRLQVPSVYNLAHVLAIQARHHARLARETRGDLHLSIHFRPQDLECHRMIEPQVGGLIHHPHTSFSQSAGDAVFALDQHPYRELRGASRLLLHVLSSVMPMAHVADYGTSFQAEKIAKSSFH